MRLTLPLLLLAAAVLAAYRPHVASEASLVPEGMDWSWPDRIENAQVLPADIGAERLRNTMVGFSRALGVRCHFCHVGEEGVDFSEWDFPSDANPHKDAARGMMRMTVAINAVELPAIDGLHDARVTCYTCHRGSAHPATQPEE